MPENPSTFPPTVQHITNWTFEEAVEDESQLKVEINTFIWMHAPKEMTLGDADDMACKIFEMMLAARLKAKAAA